MFGFSFASDWLRESGVKVKSEVKQNQSNPGKLLTRLKISLLGRSFHSLSASVPLSTQEYKRVPAKTAREG